MDAVALAMIEALPATAPTVGWQTVNSVGGAPWYSAAVSTDGQRIYLSHGLAGSTPTVTSGAVVVALDGTRPSMPNASVARRGVAGAWCNGKHYAIGGLNSSDAAVATVEAYTPAGTNGASGVWTTAATIGVALAYSSAAVLGNYIYVAGGQTNTNASTVTVGFRRYDSMNNVWSTLTDMPAARAAGVMVAVGTKLYYLGGYGASGADVTTVYVFDTVAGTWSTGTAMSTTVSVASSAAAVGSLIYMPTTNGGGGLSYDTSTGVTTSLAATSPTHGGGGGIVAISGALYYVSGSGTANVDKLDLSAGVGYTAAVLGAKSLLNPLLAGVASILPVTPPTDTTGKAAYAQTVQTLKALAAL